MEAFIAYMFFQTIFIMLFGKMLQECGLLRKCLQKEFCIEKIGMIGIA